MNKAQTEYDYIFFPAEINKYIEGREHRIDSIGKSGSKVLCFDDIVLKIERQSEEADKEYNLLKWLYSQLPVPEVIAFHRSQGINYLLMSKLDGEMAC